MRQWDILLFPFPEEQPHPVEVLSKPNQTPREGTRPTGIRAKIAFVGPLPSAGGGFERASVVIVSPDDRCLNADLKSVNGLICTSVRLNRPAKLNEILLDQADGLDWATAVRCDFLHALPKTGFLSPRGRVSEVRQSQIMRHVARCLRFRI